ncbi:MAG: fatty acyl-AMP ligase [Rhizobiales bacterium]|nr:fatty acyl-AMP ligase [Hyphomicrobiales bacterium]
MIVIRNQTILDILSERARFQPDKVVYEYLENGDTLSDKLTFAELEEIVTLYARNLSETCSSRNRIIIYASSGLSFIEMFLSCLKAGIVAVPVHMPRKSTPIEKYEKIFLDCETKHAIIAEEDETLLSENFVAMMKNRGVHLIKYKRAQSSSSDDVHSISHGTKLDNLAFIQYTSGSSGVPKGVCITHRNIVENSFMIEDAFEHTSETVMVGWLPTFHDMGLIGNVIQPIFTGFKCISMPPLAFVQKPIRWLKAISNYHATSSGGPNFGYDLMINNIKPEEREGLDLSSWKVAFNGSEPICRSTLSQFTQIYSQYGFDNTSHFPCYGMAETTLFVSGGNLTLKSSILSVSKSAFENKFVKLSSDHDAIKVVSSGVPAKTLDLAIVDPNTRIKLSNAYIGEIWISGPNVSQTYLCQPELSKEMMRAQIRNKNTESYLRTGDLGFIYNNELFVCGRIKDMMIFGGRNIFPQDIELLVGQSHPYLVHGGTAAFEIIIKGSNRLVVLQEVKRVDRKRINFEETKRDISLLIAQHFQVALHDLVFIHERSLPKTSSGKIQRSLSKTKYIDGILKKL